MTAPTHGRPGRRAMQVLGLVLSAAFMWLFAMGTAYAVDTTLTPVERLQSAPVIPLSCNPCHADISDTKLPNILFSHASHISYQCSACHSRFPHQPSGTSIPRMTECWTCHALRHGPQGIMAKYDCKKCHTDYDKLAKKRKPKTHTADWKNKPHVKPGNTQLSTLCVMCHTKESCDTCHIQKAQISWETTQSWSYDSGTGCLSCHGSDLPRLAKPVAASGLDASPHRGTSCGKCHPDFRYDDVKGKTKLWNVNAGLACADCHDHDKQTKLWLSSIHGEKVMSGVASGKAIDAPTCSGCHGGHDIERLKTEAARTRLKLSGEKMCVGACHTHDAKYASYNDWWHGAAYKRGNADAPACWNCHGAHDVKAKTDPKSATHPEQIGKTCGTCHKDSTEQFGAAWRQLPHGQVDMKASNPVTRARAQVFSGGR
ncbi:MAG: hypothetical protein Q7W30_08535 [Coriobacteriia bacterium]|nr:hypothetical protein [Coriobacteriia bacterium]